MDLNKISFKNVSKNTVKRNNKHLPSATSCISVAHFDLQLKYTGSDYPLRYMSSKVNRNSLALGKRAQTCQLTSAIKAFKFAHKRTSWCFSHCFPDVAEAYLQDSKLEKKARCKKIIHTVMATSPDKQHHSHIYFISFSTRDVVKDTFR